MTRFLAVLRSFNITAPAVLLFMALLAQAPHAAAVFVRVAPHGAPWEVYVSAVGALVYAIALEGATAFFVWRSQIRWAIAFAVFSVLHNVAYYLPEAWAFDAFGAALLWRNVLGSVLISVSLPLAIAAFSHVQAQQREKRHTATGETADETPPAPAIAPEAPEETPAPVAPPAIAPRSSADIARELGVSRQTVDGWKRRGTLTMNIARRLPTVAAPTTNGNGGSHE